MKKKTNVLFVCVANSARSQMAEGLARKLLGPDFEVQSAGSQPAKVNPFAIRALNEVEIDISKHYSKSTSDLSPDFIAQLDYVITLCAEEVCPVMISKAKKLHWPLPDPAGKGGTDEEQLERCRKIRNELSLKLKEFKSSIG
jgi:arsenate reductase